MPYKSKAQQAYFNVNKKELEKQGVTFDIIGDCWECTSHKPNNSGYPTRHGGTLNRFVYKWLIGEIQEGMQICHSCDNRLCINPSHLWQGTKRDNQLDMINKNRQFRGIGSKNPRSKLNEQQVELILKDNRFIKQIAADFGVSFQMISRIKRKEAWNAI
jgi:hypothetical protein